MGWIWERRKKSLVAKRRCPACNMGPFAPGPTSDVVFCQLCGSIFHIGPDVHQPVAEWKKMTTPKFL